MHKVKKGFTLIEVALAMVFVTVLSLIVVMLIVDAVSAYRRALTLGQINTTGMDLVEDIRTSIQGSLARSLKGECTELYLGSLEAKCIADEGAKSFVMIEKRGTVRVKEQFKNSVANEADKEFETTLFGAYCTGNYTYLWNSGYYFREDYEVVGDDVQAGIYLVRKNEFPGGIEDGKGVKLLKVKDESRAVCKTVAGYKFGYETLGGGDYKNFDDIAKADSNFKGQITVPESAVVTDPVDLLESDAFTNLAFYDLSATVPAKVEGMNTAFSAVSFILGTLQGGASINTMGNNCRVPTDYEYAEFNYCAINKFNFAAQAMGG